MIKEQAKNGNCLIESGIGIGLITTNNLVTKIGQSGVKPEVLTG